MVQLAFVGTGAATSGGTGANAGSRRTGKTRAGTGSIAKRLWVYAFAKAMRVAVPEPIGTFAFNGFEWYRGSPTTMGLAEKISQRLIASHSWTTGPWVDGNLGTAGGHHPAASALPGGTIACFNAQPNPTYPDSAVDFDPLCSGHSDPAKNIANLVLFEWDWDNDGAYDEATALPVTLSRSFPCPSIPCVYPVTLRVTDDVGNQATYRQDVRITDPPHPPVARVKGPYWLSLCDLDQLRIDASESFDPDEGNHEACPACPDDTLIAWEWDLNGALLTYPVPRAPWCNWAATGTSIFRDGHLRHRGEVTDNGGAIRQRLPT
jgi:hypothetical protein